MSVTYSSGVFLGVKLSDIGFKVEKNSTPYEIHDKKGKPTGKFETEVTFKLSFNDEERVESDLYLEYFEEMVDVKKPLYLEYYGNYECSFDPDKILIGKKLVSRDYDRWNLLSEISPIDLAEKMFEVQEEIAKQFNLNEDSVSPRIFFYFNAG